ncbi:MAG TPA: metal ABC transporter substrate-binding protein [Ilumatobacteraceae bacterium]
MPLSALTMLTSACGSDTAQGGPDRPVVVVTYSVLGAVVGDVVGAAADVVVLMPDGIDPHEWQPSAKDIEAVSDADLVVANGLHLEESLEGALDEAAENGTPVFFAGDHIRVRTIGDGVEDPHMWLDPLTMWDVVNALVPALSDAGIDVADRAATVAGNLEQLSSEIERILAPIAIERRNIVSGHESLGYFADRYGLTLVGAVIPSASSQAEASAGELAALREAMSAVDADVIFTEVGTPPDVVDAIASETGARVVELGTHNLPDDGSYRTFMRDIASVFASALGP